jgi:hypothetical protein
MSFDLVGDLEEYLSVRKEDLTMKEQYFAQMMINFLKSQPGTRAMVEGFIQQEVCRYGGSQEILVGRYNR